MKANQALFAASIALLAGVICYKFCDAKEIVAIARSADGLCLEPSEARIQTRPGNGSVRAKFRLINESMQDLSILSVEQTCSCQSIEIGGIKYDGVKGAKISARGEAPMEVVVPEGFADTCHNLKIRTEAGLINFAVFVDVNWPVVVDPAAIDLGDMIVGDSRLAKAVAANKCPRDIRLTLSNGSADLIGLPDTIDLRASRSFDIEFAFVSSIAGSVDRVVTYFGDDGRPAMRLRVLGRVASVLSADVPMLLLGNVARGLAREVVVPIVVRATDAESIDVRSAAINHKDWTASVIKVEKNTGRLVATRE